MCWDAVHLRAGPIVASNGRAAAPVQVGGGERVRRRSLSVCFAASADRVNVRGDRVNLVGRQLGTTHGGHRASRLLRMEYAFGDRFADPLQATVAPEPGSVGQIRADRAAVPVGTMAAGAGAIGNLTVEDPITEGNLLLRHSRGQGRRDGRTTRIGMDALGRHF